MKMLKTLTALAYLLITLTMSQIVNAQEIEVTIDRTEIARGETLTYTIRVFDQRQGMQLDLTPLTEDFDVLGTRTSSQIRSVNGAVESWTDYIVTLFPLNEGELTIPAIEINDSATDPVTITVVNEGPRSNQDSDELFLELEFNKETVYVQEQLLFTVRLYYTINGIRNPQFTELEMPNTVIQLIGSPNQYEKLIDGVRFGVYEKRYVIFPQRSGPLEFPDILFRGEVTDGSSNFVFRNLNTRRVTAFIEGTSVEVQERPLAVQNSEFWLPVSNLTMEETWNTDLSGLRIGDALVRTVTMVAEGLDGAVLPPFSDLAVEGLNVYPDPADVQRTFVEGAIVGTRVETTSIVPVQAGFIEIPEISIPWWNIDTNQLETTIVPATRLMVATIEGDAPAEQTIVTSENLAELLAAAPIVDQGMIDAQNEAEFIEVDASWLNYLIAAALAIVAISVYQLTIASHKKEIADYFRDRRQALIHKYIPQNNEAVAFRQLKSTASGRDLNRLRETLINWCNHFVDSREIISMEDILQQKDSVELHEYAHGIQVALFNNNNSSSSTNDFDHAGLLKLISSLRRQKLQALKQRRQQDRFALPPLYKT